MARRKSLREGEAVMIGHSAIALASARNGKAILIIPDEENLTFNEAARQARQAKSATASNNNRYRSKRRANKRLD